MSSPASTRRTPEEIELLWRETREAYRALSSITARVEVLYQQIEKVKGKDEKVFRLLNRELNVVRREWEVAFNHYMHLDRKQREAMSRFSQNLPSSGSRDDHREDPDLSRSA